MLAVIDDGFPEREFKPGESAVGEVGGVCGVMDDSTVRI